MHTYIHIYIYLSIYIYLYLNFCLMFSTLSPILLQRGRDDGKSCYVIQSQYTFAEDLIKSVEINLSGASPDEIRAAVARACEDPLLSAFLGTLGGEVMLETRAMFARGHRWGAAAVKGELPAVAPQLHCYADRASGVVAVGDYLAREGSGKVEGAVVSSLEAARVLASW